MSLEEEKGNSYLDTALAESKRIGIRQRIDPKRTALVLVDMQNVFVEEGAPIYCPYPGREILCANNAKLVSFFREHNLPRIWLQWFVIPESLGPMLSGPHTALDLLRIGGRDTYWTEIVDEVKPMPNERIVNKHLYDGFFDTDLYTVLRTMDIQYVVFTGVATNICVGCTVRSAWHLQFVPVLATDATGTFDKESQDLGVKMLTYVGAWPRTTDEIIAELSKELAEVKVS